MRRNMSYLQYKDELKNWRVEKIGVIGPGIVGMPMAAMLAYSKIKIGQDEPAKVVVVQRKSKTSGWKVNSINEGNSVIGGIEPELDHLVHSAVNDGILSASDSYNVLSDADVILVCVQTDKKGLEPDYDPLFEALTNTAEVLQNKKVEKKPLIIIESTLGPSSMESIIKPFFAKYGLIEGKNIYLGNSPNRVMPGRLVERIRRSDKLVAGLNPLTPHMISKIYCNIVTEGTLYKTNSLTAEVVKTFENAYRDVRIAFSAEIAEYCDFHDINFYTVRDKVNSLLNQKDRASDNPNEVPTGGLLIPMIGVGGHCLPKDGILLWWRKIESGADTSMSLILKSRDVNNSSPSNSIKLAETKFGDISGKRVALLGTAYRFNSEDTRNSPTLVLADKLLEQNCNIVLHDPYVKVEDKNLEKYGLTKYFSNDLEKTLMDAEYIFLCTAHAQYLEEKEMILKFSKKLKGVFDGCNIYNYNDFIDSNIIYTGIGRGRQKPNDEFINYVYEGFRLVEKGVSNELLGVIEFLNQKYADDDFNKINFEEVQKLAGSCTTGCDIVEPGIINAIPSKYESISRLVKCSIESQDYVGNQY
jgi:UDP-N-acetyl-D-mannosaminuronic acid dehydrogenase